MYHRVSPGSVADWIAGLEPHQFSLDLLLIRAIINKKTAMNVSHETQLAIIINIYLASFYACGN
jgi:hypothetical protein